MLDTTPIIQLFGNAKLAYGDEICSTYHTRGPVASVDLLKKLQREVQAVRDWLVPGMNAEESVEYVLGLKKGIVSKLFSKSVKAADWKIELGVLMIYLDRTGQRPDELPILPTDKQRLESIFRAVKYDPNGVRRERFETFRSLYRCHTPETVAAGHLLDILLAALEDWVRLEQTERKLCVADAFDLNDQCRDKLKEGNIAASNLAHVGLHEALTADPWRGSIRAQLQLTIAAFEPSQADIDPVERANDEHLSHEGLIDQYALWTDVSQLPAARTFVAKRHSGHSSLLRMPLK